MIERYNIQFNPDVVKDLDKIDEKIKEDNEKENIDPQKLMELKMAKLMRGMMLTTGYNNNYRGGIPY